MFQIIRCAEDFSLIIVVSPSQKKVGVSEKFYRMALEGIEGHESEVFHEISGDVAMSYPASDAVDWRDFMELPTDSFPTFETVLEWAKKSRDEWNAEKVRSLGAHPDQKTIGR